SAGRAIRRVGCGRRRWRPWGGPPGRRAEAVCARPPTSGPRPGPSPASIGLSHGGSPESAPPPPIAPSLSPRAGAVRWAAGEGTAYAGVRESVCIGSDGEPVASLFHPPPPEPGLQDFRVPGSPVDLFDGLRRSPCRSPGMDCDVASLADYQRLAFHGGHREHPARPLRSPFHVEVCELPDVVDLDLLSGAAEFARIREEPGYQLGSWGWRAILVREAIFDVHERI